MEFEKYIQNLFISENFKCQILDKRFKDSNPIYYQNYPSLFAHSFSVEESVLSLLDISGYLFYQAILFTDSLIDDKQVLKLPLITICQEEGIKILMSVYGLDQVFWKLWNNRKNEYLEAIYLEKELLNRTIVTLDEYEILADKKSTYGKVAIDCLFCLDNKGDIYEQLLLSHKYFSVAFQLHDDIQDFKEDIRKGQFNWAVYLLKKEDIVNENPEILEKYLYIRGVTKQIYQLAIQYCDKSFITVKDINVPKWKKTIIDTRKTFINAIIEIDNYIEILISEINLSNKTRLTNTIQESITDAVKFIKFKQQQDGSWHEYVNQGGISNIWATAFILSKISENPDLKLIFKNEIAKALAFLNQSTTNSIWGYNTTWIEDADTTNFVFLSYFYNDIKIKNAYYYNWIEYQYTNGGFSTYIHREKLIEALDDKNISDIEGWLSAHSCVSSVSFYFLAKQNKNSNALFNVKEYFKSLNTVNSYWWTSNIYTYYYLAKTAKFLNDIESLNSIVDEIKLRQNINGSFSDIYGENMFYTGLALEILLLVKNSEKHIEKAIEFLLQNQFEDGSWQNSNALQVPNPQDIGSTNLFFPIATVGLNVRAKEFNRLFTTTAILQSLSLYEYKYNSIVI